MKKEKMASNYNSLSTLSKSIFLLVGLILFFFPSQVLISNFEFWNHNLTLLLPYYLLGSILMILGYLIFKKRESRIASFVLLSIFWIILLSDVLAAVDMAHLDGSDVVSPESLSKTIIELGILVLIPMLIYLFRRKLEAAVKFSLLLVVVFTLINIVNLMISSPAPIRKNEGMKVENVNTNPNIYHIVLDEMQTDAAMIAIKRMELADQLAGFTLYKNNQSNYLYTHASFPSFMTSTLFDVEKDSYQDWQYSFSQEGIAPFLEKKGYEQWYYAAEGRWIPEQANHTTNLAKVKANSLGSMQDQFRFISLILAQTLPNILTNEAIQVGVIANQVFGDNLLTEGFQNGIEPYVSMIMLDQIQEEESLRPQSNQYVYFHPVLPHQPYIFDAECKYGQDLPGTKPEKYVDQTECALRKVVDFFELLKAEGKYDSSIIIVQSDHGDGHSGFFAETNEGIVSGTGNKSLVADSKRTTEWVQARSYPLLLIKPAGENADFEISNLNTQLLDLYPTLVAMLGEEKVESQGENIFSLADDEQRRIKKFFWSRPGEPTGKVYEYEIEDYNVNLKLIGEVDS